MSYYALIYVINPLKGSKIRMEDKKIYLPKTYDAITAINNALAGLESAFEVQSKNFEKQLAAKDSSLAQKQKELELLKSSSAGFRQNGRNYQQNQ